MKKLRSRKEASLDTIAVKLRRLAELVEAEGMTSAAEAILEAEVVARDRAYALKKPHAQKPLLEAIAANERHFVPNTTVVAFFMGRSMRGDGHDEIEAALKVFPDIPRMVILASFAAALREPHAENVSPLN